MVKLYGYWRSSASYRVRIALNLKQIEYEYVPVHLVKDGGQQHSTDYAKLNPAELVPSLVDGELVLTQSLAIMEYLDTKAGPRLVPEHPERAAIVRSMALDMACDLQPITNLRILQYLSGTLECTDEKRQQWIEHWVRQAFGAFEQQLQRHAGIYCVGDTISMADVCLVPQIYNARRFNIDLTAYPILRQVEQNLMQLEAFQKAVPEQQPDAAL